MSEIRLESRPRSSQEQFVALIEFMESRGDIARPQKGPQGRIKADRLWDELTEILNSIGGGVNKSMDKWKKVWADWKTKTKKKALGMRREAGGTGGGPSSRLTSLEQRVLGVMGLKAAVGQEAPSQTKHQIPATEEIELELPTTPFQLSPPPPAPVFTQMPSAPSPMATTMEQGAPRPRRPATPSPVASPTTSWPRRHRLFRGRTRRVQTPFERATNEFVAVENRRLQLEEVRQHNQHQVEMERLRLEGRRVEMEANQNQILSRLVDVLNNITEILPQLRLKSEETEIKLIYSDHT